MLPKQKKHGVLFLAVILTFTPGISIDGQRETDTQTLLVTCRCLKFLPLIRFLLFKRTSPYFRLINLAITLLSWPLLFRERGSQWHLHQRCCSVCLVALLYSFGYIAPLSSDIFSKFIIFSSNLLFTFCVITSSLLSFLFSI